MSISPSFILDLMMYDKAMSQRYITLSASRTADISCLPFILPQRRSSSVGEGNAARQSNDTEAQTSVRTPKTTINNQNLQSFNKNTAPHSS
jgi:hypothetical protein